jgi:hypothetical protein
MTMILTQLRIVVLTAILGCCFLGARSQVDTLVVSAQFENVSLHQALDFFAEKYDIDFAYDIKALRSLEVDFVFDEVLLSNALKTILASHELEYEQIGETIVIFTPDRNSEASEKPERFAVTITGKVSDVATGERLPYASIRVMNGGQVGFANQDGYFTLFNVPNDTALLRVTYIGYKPLLYRISPETNLKSVHVEMEAHSDLLPSANVFAEQIKAMEINREVSTFSINSAKVSRVPNLGEADIYKAVQLLPGVTSTVENSGGLNIRGGKSDENLILYDGFTIYHQDHFYGIYSAFNPLSIKNIRVYKGAYDVKYGGRSSGVLEIEGRDGSTKKPSVKIGLNLISTNFLVETPIIKDKLSIMIAGRRAYTDVLQSDTYKSLFNNLYNSNITPPDQQSVDVFNSEGSPDFSFYDLTAKLSWKPTEKDQISLSMYSGLDQLELTYEEELTEEFSIRFNDESQWGNTGVGASWSRKWSENYYSKLIAGFSSYQNDLSAADIYFRQSGAEVDTNFYSHENDFRDLSLQWNNEYSLPKHDLSFGVNVNYNNLDYTFGTEVNTDTIQDEGIQSAVYLQDRWQLSDKTTFRPGVRLAYYDVTDDFLFEPRAAIYHKIHKNIRLKAAAGVHYQVVKRILRQDIYLNTPDLWRLSNDTTIPITLSNHYIIGFAWDLGKYAIDAELYYKTIFGTEQELPYVDAGINAGQSFVFGEGEVYGLDLMLQKKTGRYTGWIAYTLSRAQSRFNELADESYIPSSLNQLHEFKWVSFYNWRKWEFSSVFTIASGRPYTPLLGTYDLETPNDAIANFVVFGEVNSARLPTFHRLDVSIAYNFSVVKGRAKAGATVYNVYDRVNVKGKRYFAVPDPDNELSFSAGERDVPTLGITPSVFLNFEF